MLLVQVRTPRRGPSEVEVAVPAGLLLYKLEEVNQSVKVLCLYIFLCCLIIFRGFIYHSYASAFYLQKIESLVVGSHSEAVSIDS